MFISPAYAQAGGGGGDIFGSILPLVLIFAVFYFLLIRPQQRKVKAHREMLTRLSRGDQVITGGGILAKVTKVNNDAEVTVEIADNVRVVVARNTIASVLTAQEGGGEGAAAVQSAGPKSFLGSLLGGRK